ncbi:hypothetical protein JCM10914_4680 [Paenibacillus sp. JCM 10914]|nr:hypothetical protein JCM10914_4680 [Paenibacillus sp. JCM 10914]
MRNARLIYNPTSGREEMKRRLADILHRLDSAGIETSCHATTGRGMRPARLQMRLSGGMILSLLLAGMVRSMKS